MIPERLMEFCQACPLLEEITDWKLLRKWSLSEVYRATLKTGEHLIVKWGGKGTGQIQAYRCKTSAIRSCLVLGAWCLVLGAD